MSTPPLPPGEGHPGSPPDDAPRLRSDPAGPAATPPQEDDDLFAAADEPSDDTPTVISRLPPRPISSEDVFGGTLRGRRLAHFELIEPIGVGGMAAVIRARDLQLERQVALKILPPEMAADDENVRRFHQEARAAAKLDHENIARVFFCGEDQKLHFIAFEFVEGPNLRTLLERRGRLQVAEAIRYMIQVAAGLAHAATRGVIHRDIKPSNIIISPHGRAKLVDMGLARQVDLTKDQGLTQSGVTLGTFDYISPEQALEPRDADIRSDLYSLGCTFYHALTGQAPVPEGTAARKLHHHQHVAPVDPRQLNPDIPDEVAAILARMMAKDPKDRYQRAEHLVQHLMQVAQKLGAVSEVPDGVLFVDAPLPSPPRPRPVLMAVAAALVLVVLVVLLGQTTPRGTATRRLPVTPARTPDQAAAKAPSGEVPPAAADSSPARPPEPVVVAPAPPPVYDKPQPKAQEIADFLSKVADKPASSVYLAADLALDDVVGGGLVFEGLSGSTLTIEPAKGVQWPTIRLQFNAKGSQFATGPVWGAALTVKGGTVVLRNLRFEVDAHQAPGSVMAALWRQGGRIQVENCEFVQVNPPQSEPGQLSAILVDGPAAGGDPAVSARRCWFLCGPTPAAARAAVAGQNAVTVHGGGLVELSNCAFGPHAAAVALQGGKDRAYPLTGAKVQLQHCSALLAGDTAVVRLENAQRCSLQVEDCLFSRPEEAGEGEAQAVLVRQADDAARNFWTGSGNRYHNLDAFWLRPDDDALTNLADFKRETKDGDGQLVPFPWQSEEPLGLLDAASLDGLRKAFQVRGDLPELRQRGDPDNHLVGVESLAGSEKPYNRDLPSLKEHKTDSAVARHVKVVNPDAKARGPGDYSSLADALEDAAPGDTVLLRCTGRYEVRPIPLSRANLDVTIKPDRDCHPVLTLHPDTDEVEAALFRLWDGKLRLEGLAFALRPANGKFKTQTVVAALGEGACTFQDCTITLEQANDARLAAVTLADLPGVMKMDRPARPSGQHATLAFHNCFIRGDGDLIAARAGRSFDLDVDNVLVVLGGSLLNREAADDAAALPADTADELRLAKVTAYLGGSLVRCRARDARAQVQEQFRSVSDCLFVSAGSRALVHLEGAEVSDERLKALLKWTGQHNAYTDFPQLLDQQPDNGAMPAMLYTHDKWKEFTGETDAVFDRVRLDGKPGADTPLSGVTPARFRVKPDEMRAPDMQGYGADLDPLPRVSAPADALMTPPDE